LSTETVIKFCPDHITVQSFVQIEHEMLFVTTDRQPTSKRYILTLTFIYKKKCRRSRTLTCITTMELFVPGHVLSLYNQTRKSTTYSATQKVNLLSCVNNTGESQRAKADTDGVDLTVCLSSWPNDTLGCV